jgi:hypothetical protein
VDENGKHSTYGQYSLFKDSKIITFNAIKDIHSDVSAA